LLDGNAAQYVVTQAVLHGQIKLGFTASISGSGNAAFKGDIIKAIAKAFSITEAEVNVSKEVVSFLISESDKPMTLAIVPAYYSSEELARITYFMQGERGAHLELAVREAIAARPVGWLEQLATHIRELLGDEELTNKERWAERVVNGGGRRSAREVATLDTVDFNRVATYGAAMELVRLEAPTRNQ
jgi:hypothetical protein